MIRDVIVPWRVAVMVLLFTNSSRNVEREVVNSHRKLPCIRYDIVSSATRDKRTFYIFYGYGNTEFYESLLERKFLDSTRNSKHSNQPNTVIYDAALLFT